MDSGRSGTVMEKLVVDSSVVVKWLSAEPHSAEALRILDDYQQDLLRLCAPDLIYAEVGNVIWKKHRFQGVSAADAQLMIDGLLGLSLTLTSTSALLDDAFRLAVAHQRSVYDMLYIALSIRESCRVVTADEKLVNAIGESFPGLAWLANWP
jgi:predicted nucleic acid-binding protein